jgi:endonuclease G
MVPTADPDASRLALEAGKRAVKKIAQGRKIPELTDDEKSGIEAIVLAAGRPALLVQNSDFLQPPGPWGILESHRATIHHVIGATARIETPKGPHPWIGTGFLVGPTVVAVPDYMVSMLGHQQGKRWKLENTFGLRIDFLQEFGSAATADHAVVDIIGADASLGVALLEVDGRGNLPPPLTLAARPNLTPDRKVYLVGYPSRDTRRPDEFMHGVLENIFDVKRLCPGQILKAPSPGDVGHQNRSMIEHDCSSSGGMGGAPLVDLKTGETIGLHYSARYLIAGYAKPLWLLQGTRLGLDADLSFH